MFTSTRKNTSTSMTFQVESPETATQTSEPSFTRTFADDPFRARFSHRLPRGLRQEARGMDWKTFTSTYAPTSGHLEIRDFTSHRGRGGRSDFTATITSGRGTDTPRTQVREVSAMGPVSAATNLLADAGYRVEIVEFHQMEIFEATVTFIYAAHNNTRVWTMGFGQTPENSIITAMTAAANRLHN